MRKISVSLNPNEIQEAARRAHHYAQLRRQNRFQQRFPDDENEVHLKTIGFAGQWGVSKLLNLKVNEYMLSDSEFQETRKNFADLGRDIVVRVKQKPFHRLFIRPYDKDEYAYVSVLISPRLDSITFYGWLWGHEAKRLVPLSREKGEPAHWIPNAKLKPFEELTAYLATKERMRQC